MASTGNSEAPRAAEPATLTNSRRELVGTSDIVFLLPRILAHRKTEIRQNPLTLPVKYSISRGSGQACRREYSTSGRRWRSSRAPAPASAPRSRVLFAAQRARVVVLDRDEAAARRTADQIGGAGGQAAAIACDVADGAQVDRRVRPHRGGARPRRHPGQQRRDRPCRHDRAHDRSRPRSAVSRSTSRASTCAPAPRCRSCSAQGGGVILNMASIASLVGVPERFAYSMTKGAVHTMTMSIAIDYVKQNIRCNCICPARIHTPFVDELRRAPLCRPRARDAGAAGGLSADRAHGDRGGSRASRALPLLGRSGVRHRPGVPDRRRRAGRVKLIRFGEPGRETAGAAARQRRAHRRLGVRPGLR